MDTFTVQGRGHSLVSATSGSDVRLPSGSDVRASDTDMVGHSFRWDAAAALEVRGGCDVELRAGDFSHRFKATISPTFTGSSDLVLRVGRERVDSTFAHGSTAAPSSLSREFADALTSEDTDVFLHVRPTGEPFAGALFVIGVPIGHLDDVTHRLRRVLGAVDLVLAEDTRRLRSLARESDIDLPPVRSHHHFNEDRAVPHLIERLLKGERIAMVSDAGTPSISDPGQTLVRAAHKAGVGVHPVPGPSALAAVLSVAGIPTSTATFVGFPPRKPSARRRRLAELGALPGALVLFEAPHRLIATLDDISVVLPDRDLFLAGDMTKSFETMELGLTTNARDLLVDDPRGEYSIMIGPSRTLPVVVPDIDPLVVKLVGELAAAVPSRVLRDAVETVTGCSRNRAYDLVLSFRSAAKPPDP